jgi:magnesium transporter
MIHLFAFDSQSQKYIDNASLKDLPHLLQNDAVLVWADFDTPTSEEWKILSDVFAFDSLAIEDCMHARQAPKLESFDDYHFFIIQCLGLSNLETDWPQSQFEVLELDGFLGDRYLVTVHDGVIPSIERAKQHIRQHNHSHIRQGTAYLAYEILDHLIDMYLPMLDYLDDKIKALETRPFSQDTTREYIALSNKLLDTRRIAVKNQQVFYQFAHSNLSFIDANEARLFRDIYDHTVRVVDMAEYYQQALRGALDIQFSASTNRVNEVVQYLTLFATIMLPLNVVTGIYGMNLKWLPWAEDPNGFWMIVGLMMVIIVALLWSIRRQGWA